MILTSALYAILSVIIVSLVSLAGVITLLWGEKKIHKFLLVLVGLSAGTLLGDAFLHLLPETAETSGFTLIVSLLVLAGILVFFILEKSIHAHHFEAPSKQHLHHPKKSHVGSLVLFGDGLHNFMDGLAIAAAYLINFEVGIATTLAVFLHEIPQEIADFGVLLYAGFSKGKALFYNFVSALAAVAGAVVGLIVGKNIESAALYILPFTAGGFIYIACASLIPELHKECGWKESLWQILAFVAGIGVMVVLLLLE